MKLKYQNGAIHDVTMQQLTAVVLARHIDLFKDIPEMGGVDWSNAAAGEMGEACNIVKKIGMHNRGFIIRNEADEPIPYDGLLEMLGFEITDTIHYLLLLAAHYNVHIPQHFVSKFNEKSHEWDLPDFEEYLDLIGEEEFEDQPRLPI